LNIKIFNHNQQTLHEQFYCVTTCFDPELESSSSHNTKMREYERIAAHIHILYDTRMQEYEPMQKLK